MIFSVAQRFRAVHRQYRLFLKEIWYRLQRKSFVLIRLTCCIGAGIGDIGNDFDDYLNCPLDVSVLQILTYPAMKVFNPSML